MNLIPRASVCRFFGQDGMRSDDWLVAPFATDVRVTNEYKARMNGTVFDRAPETMLIRSHECEIVLDCFLF